MLLNGDNVEQKKEFSNFIPKMLFFCSIYSQKSLYLQNPVQGHFVSGDWTQISFTYTGRSVNPTIYTQITENTKIQTFPKSISAI